MHPALASCSGEILSEAVLDVPVGLHWLQRWRISLRVNLGLDKEASLWPVRPAATLRL